MSILTKYLLDDIDTDNMVSYSRATNIDNENKFRNAYEIELFLTFKYEYKPLQN